MCIWSYIESGKVVTVLCNMTSGSVVTMLCHGSSPHTPSLASKICSQQWLIVFSYLQGVCIPHFSHSARSNYLGISSLCKVSNAAELRAQLVSFSWSGVIDSLKTILLLFMCLKQQPYNTYLRFNFPHSSFNILVKWQEGSDWILPKSCKCAGNSRNWWTSESYLFTMYMYC